MSASASGRGLVAITGSNGTIGYACVIYALRNGYRVRCIVRREAAVKTIKSGPSVQQYLDHLDFALVPDNTVEGAYDEALVDATYVVHIAGAWPMPHVHPDEEIYYPFIQSTENIVKAAEKSGTVQRIVFTQAGAGLIDTEIGDVYGNRMDLVLNEHVQPNAKALTYRPPLKHPQQAYCASKSQCMTYLNNLRLENSKQFSIVQVIPGTVIGPSEFATTAAQAFAHMDRHSRALLFDEFKHKYAFGFVHVNDCARVHIEALDEQKVKSEDVPPWFIAAGSSEDGCNGEILWSKAADMVEREFSKEVEEGVFKLGRGRTPINMPYRVDATLTENMLLGSERIRGLEECIRDVAQWYVELKKRDTESSQNA